ncbi:MAG: lipoyl(octanoyl) transferase LipB [Marinobacterium sp.]|nr:lipoyl(octanoyl) transferase LipB [Marinobacterium sp.]
MALIEQPLTEKLIVRQLGLQPYLATWQRMQDFTAERNEQTVDEIWQLEHEPVFTQGYAGKSEHLIATGDIPVVEVDRGGQVTYHGPGQSVVYLLLDIRRRKLGPKHVVAQMEQSVIDLLADYGIEAFARPDAPGVYVGDAKIASLGLRVKHGRTFHGLACNINMDMAPFLRINPCGYAGMAMTQLAELVPELDTARAHQRLVKHLTDRLGYTDIEQRTELDA